MKTIGNKVFVIVLIVIALLAITGGAFAYLYFATDTFKTSQELFAKYLMQNLSEVNQTVNLKKVDELDEKLKQSKYEERFTISYTEEGEAEPAGQITIDTQNDSINKKVYGIIELLSEGNEDSIELEYMIEDDMYSLRFTNAVKQFLTIENANLQEFAQTLGIDEEIVEQIPNQINSEMFSFDELKFTEEEKNTEINKYANLLYNNIDENKYTKTKNTVITLNGKTITTNAYILTLNIQDIKNIVIKFLETLKQDEIVLAKLEVLEEMISEYYEGDLKAGFINVLEEAITQINADNMVSDKNIVITVYEEKGKAVRIKLENDLDTITIDASEIDSKKQIDFSYTSMDTNNTQLSSKITFIKENENKLTLQNTNINGEEQQAINLDVELIENENNTKLNVVLENHQGDQLAINREINFVEEINYRVTLDDSNNLILNDLTKEQIEYVFNALGEKLEIEYTEYLQPVLKTLAIPIITMALSTINEASETLADTNLSEEEIKAFNSKFQRYERNNVSTANVNALLSTVLLHNQQEKMSGRERFVEVTGDVTLEVDATEITRLVESKYYKVECKLDKGLVNKIEVTEAKKQ